jgi:hypothetical protein
MTWESKRHLLFLKTLRALLNDSGTFGVYPKPPNIHSSLKMQPVFKDQAHKHTDPGAQTILTTLDPNINTKPPDSQLIQAQFSKGAAQPVQRAPKSDELSHPHGTVHRNILPTTNWVGKIKGRHVRPNKSGSNPWDFFTEQTRA